MKIAIHQPHYFPWLGYLAKMAQVDTFVLLDQVQFEKGSPMIRNRVIDTNGEIKYMTISADTRNFLSTEYKSICVKDTNVWTVKQKNMLKNYYSKAKGYKEVYPIISKYLDNSYSTLCEWTCESIYLLTELFGIKTPIVMQSEIDYDRDKSKSELVEAICVALKGEIYYSGKGGSVNYLNRESFSRNNIQIEFQDYKFPEYEQINTSDFVPGVSSLDLLFNCGIEKSKQLFWDSLDK